MILGSALFDRTPKMRHAIDQIVADKVELVAIGTNIAVCPSRRSVRAELPHTALA
jgi:hypothetical protein